MDVDVVGFFDNIDHGILIDLLNRKIDDKRFIRLIEGMLKAGYMEDWSFNATYSGTPQGGVVSPILANIYDGNFYIASNASGFAFATWDATTQYSTVNICDGQPHHIEMTGGEFGMKLFVDGNLVISSARPMSATSIVKSSLLTVRAFPGAPSLAWTGTVEEVAFWDGSRHTASFLPPTSAYTGSEPNQKNLYHFDDNGTDSTVPASAATAITLSGPTTGQVGSASTDFAVGANGTINGTVVVTPSDASGGGTFTPTSVSISSASPSATYKYTPVSAGAKAISVANNGSLTNPTAITYTASSGMVVIPRTDAALYYAPYVWHDNGSAMCANTCGAYVKYNFNGTAFGLNNIL